MGLRGGRSRLASAQSCASRLVLLLAPCRVCLLRTDESPSLPPLLSLPPIEKTNPEGSDHAPRSMLPSPVHLHGHRACGAHAVAESGVEIFVSRVSRFGISIIVPCQIDGPLILWPLARERLARLTLAHDLLA
jgi:hypothetical protein